ncbi:MAG: hypothetical protein Q8L53_16685 [Aestuariivirga sp.]|nr:hypothetical protein [Aestuariivirga sp.]
MPSFLGSAPPSTLDDASRALQGAVAREWENRSYTTSSGTAPNFVVAYTVAPAALRSGQTYTFTAHANADGTDTLNVNTLGAKNIMKVVAGSKTATAANDFYEGDKIACVYDGTDMVWSNRGVGEAAASTSAAGISELLTTTELLTGTDTTRAATADSIAALWEAGADITDGAAIPIGEGGYFNLITSTTAITSFSITTDKAGRTFRVRFNTARTLTHNGTSLIIPGAANITTAQGDIAQIRSLGGGNVVVEWYQKASGLSIVDRAPTVIKKAGDQSVASTTLANDSDFTFALAANTKYIVEMHLDVTHTGSEGFKFDITGPASPNSVTISGYLNEKSSGISTNASAGEPVDAFSATISLDPQSSAIANAVLIKAYINNGVNAGTFQFRWANGTTSTSKMVKARSWMMYQVVN